MGRISAVAQCLVRDIDGVGAGFGDAEAPCGLGLLSFLFGGAFRYAGRAHPERVLILYIDLAGIGEAFACGDPAAPFVVFSLAPQHALALAPERGVVVGYDFIRLYVAFARSHHIRPGVLQHGDEEGEHVALRVHVLHRGEQRGPLPGPSTPSFVVVAPMTLPEGYVAASETLGIIPFPHARDKGAHFPAAVGITVDIRRGTSLVAACRCHQVFHRVILAEYPTYGAV